MFTLKTGVGEVGVVQLVGGFGGGVATDAPDEDFGYAAVTGRTCGLLESDHGLENVKNIALMVLFETTVFAKQPYLGIFYACKLSQYTVKILNSPVCGASVFCLVFILLLVIFCGGLGTLNSVGTAFQFNLFFEGLVNWLLSKCSAQSLQLVLR